MLKLRNNKGFTFLEILVALGIMAFGFLAMSQMQFLSLRQKQLAEDGTIATNMIQFIADRDMAELKRVHLLNSIAFIEAQAGRLNPGNENEPHLKYCRESNADHVCKDCPCNPLESIALIEPLDGGSETSCAVIGVNDFDPENVEFHPDKTDCVATNNDEMFVVKQIDTTRVNPGEIPAVFRLDVTYSVKNRIQFDESNFDSVSIKDSLAAQQFSITSHQEDWSEIIAGWNPVNIPHIP